MEKREWGCRLNRFSGYLSWRFYMEFIRLKKGSGDNGGTEFGGGIE